MKLALCLAAAAVAWGTTGAVQHPVQYLRALQVWKRTESRAVRRGCPPPEACACHCDCQATTFEKPPPPLLPCPTFYPPYPTNPPQAKKAEVTTTTEAPTTTTTTTGFVMPNCELGEVAMSDGKCLKITPEVIDMMRKLVSQKKHLLDVAEGQYPKAGKMGSCTNCRLSSQIVVQGGNLLYAHIEYKKALDMLLAMMMLYTPPPAAAAPAAGATALGPEFVVGDVPGGQHCETWTGNTTKLSTPEQCAILCRHQPFCKSFAVDVLGHCVWMDYKPPSKATECAESANLNSFHIKERNVTTANPCGAKFTKVTIVTQLLDAMLATSENAAMIANQSLEAWGAEQNETLKIDLENFFLAAKQNYTDSIVEVTTIRNDRRFSIDDALKCISEDSVELPALPTTTTTTTTTTTSGTTTLPPPVVELHWADFPNSQDSLWSQKHPECPQGPPCFCDCKCRGGPPQNFVEPPPPLPAPCPGPPPLPPPGSYSMPLGAPALDPGLMR